MAWYKETFATLDPVGSETHGQSEKSSRQVDFILDELASEAGLCCGQGRHLIELAARGYDVVGLDLSEHMSAGCETTGAGAVEPVLVHADTCDTGCGSEFDAVMNVLAALGCLESDCEDQQVISAASLTLKGGGLLSVNLIRRRHARTSAFENASYDRNRVCRHAAIGSSRPGRPASSPRT